MAFIEQKVRFILFIYGKKTVSLLLFILFGILEIYPQISGRVVDKKDNSPLIGVNIYDQKRKNGGTSKVDGQFFLDIDGLTPDDIIIFSYVGYQAKKHPDA